MNIFAAVAVVGVECRVEVDAVVLAAVTAVGSTVVWHLESSVDEFLDGQWEMTGVVW